MITFLFVLVLLFTAGLFYNNFTAFNFLRKNIYSNTTNTLIMYEKNLDERFRQTETYLLSKLIDNNQTLTSLRTASMHETSWFSSFYQLSTNFNASLPCYTTNCFFCYIPEKNQYIQSNNTNASVAAALKKEIIHLITSEELQNNTWMLISVNDTYYFVYGLNYFGTYIGTWCSMQYLLNSVSDSGNLYFSTSDGKLFRNNASALWISAPEDSHDVYRYELIEGTKMLSISYPLETSSFYLTTLIPKSEISQNYSTLINVILIVAVFFFLIWFLIFVFLRRYILKPIYSLTSAIAELRNGNMDVHISTSKDTEEFQNMSDAFNEMVHEIRDLKIDVYERKLQRQRLETQYLKQQITPHFMINCLNTVYQLTDTNHSDLAKQMLRELSNHLRYTLSSGHIVPLSEELKLSENYIELSKIRYPNSILYYVDCPEELLDATAIPLLILNFIENTIKYEISVGELIEIHVEISKVTKEKQDFIDICIWDTGSGFSDDFLTQLKDLDYYSEHEIYHIGIVNTYLRAKHIYSNPKFQFHNRKNAGAEINILLPYMPFTNYAFSKGESL